MRAQQTWELLTGRRGGTRGGAAEFSWDAVREDRHRENYLGHSVAAPKGRWQQNRDIHWYNRESTHGLDAKQRKQELADVKRAEQEAMETLLYVTADATDAVVIP